MGPRDEFHFRGCDRVRDQGLWQNLCSVGQVSVSNRGDSGHHSARNRRHIRGRASNHYLAVIPVTTVGSYGSYVR